ncbi:MAG TPA: YicC/YloC family endoribonuclease [Vicinamibacterales bacterium]
MTGFASLTHDDETATIGVSVKSVNHRFLDLQLRVPPLVAPLESRIRGLVQERISRGRIEVAISVQQRRTPALEVELNEDFLEALGSALGRARAAGHITGAMTPGDLLRFPQALAIREKPADAAGDEDLLPRIEEAIRAAIVDLDAMRAKEGEFLRADLDARRELLATLFEQVHAASENGRDGLRARLEERVKTLRADALAEEALIAQEIARFVGRSDITEEVVRFRGHLEHWKTLSDAPEPCGRKLDFLLQEMNREVNTVASKAEGPAVSELIVSLKAELEKMREQVQNVE